MRKYIIEAKVVQRGIYQDFPLKYLTLEGINNHPGFFDSELDARICIEKFNDADLPKMYFEIKKVYVK